MHAVPGTTFVQEIPMHTLETADSMGLADRSKWAYFLSSSWVCFVSGKAAAALHEHACMTHLAATETPS